MEARLQAHNERLTGDLNPRQRRRILQKISKLKKQMSTSSETSTIGDKRNATDSNTATSNKRLKTNNEELMKPSLNRKQRKKKIMGTNNRLKDLARRKQLTKAEQCFQRAKKANLVDVHTYTSMLNVYVRVGAVDRALEAFREMRTRRLQPNVVTYTTLLKGLGADARFGIVLQLLDEMVVASPPQLPTIRTVNTLVRSYARHGRPDLATSLLHRCRQEWNVNVDASTYEHLISVLSNAHRTQEIKTMIEQLRHAASAVGDKPKRMQQTSSTSSSSSGLMTLAGEADAAENPAIYIDCARACVLVGDVRAAGLMLQEAHKLLNNDDVFLDRRTQMSRSQLSVVGQGKGDLASNARLMASKQHARVRSMKEFAEHRVDDLQREMASLTAYLQNRSSGSIESLARVLHALPQMLLLGGVENDTVVSGATNPSAASSSVPSAASSSAPSSSTKINLTEQVLGALRVSSGLDSLVEGDESKIISIRNTLNNAIDNQTIHFHKLLNKPKEIPVKMEICSGNGEWATSCCAEENRKNKNTSLWVTMELRRDRVQRTFSSMLLKNAANNMCVVGGDASKIVTEHVASASVDYLFINHPEPPERNSGTSGTQGGHLLEITFLRSLKRIMKKTGMLTIVTDNLPYAKSLVQTCHEAGFKSGTCDDASGVDVLASVGNVHLMEGMPGTSEGYTKGTESYFDRLWQRGQRSRRFYLAVVKE